MTDLAVAAPKKFADPDLTAKGERRARVALDTLRTLWINTGSLCNITCRNCYIKSSPEQRPARLSSRAPRRPPISTRSRATAWPVREIGFTGGEPFMNPDIIEMLGDALGRGFSVLVLTNAMQPMLRPRIRDGLSHLARRSGIASCCASASTTIPRSCTTPSGAQVRSPRRSRGSTG